MTNNYFAVHFRIKSNNETHTHTEECFFDMSPFYLYSLHDLHLQLLMENVFHPAWLTPDEVLRRMCPYTCAFARLRVTASDTDIGYQPLGGEEQVRDIRWPQQSGGQDQHLERSTTCPLRYAAICT